MRFLKNTYAFFSALFHNPRAIGAIVPSSKYLARNIAQLIDTAQPGYVLELGPGTGAITKIILQHVKQDQFIALEISSDLTASLKKNFPGMNVIEGDATRLSEVIQQKPVHTIISSLPLLSLAAENRDQILLEIPKILSPHGKFIQYTYALKNKNEFYPKNFTLEKSFIVWRNIPPARVDVFRVHLN